MNALTLIQATVEPTPLLNVPSILKAAIRSAKQAGYIVSTEPDVQIEHRVGDDCFLVCLIETLGGGEPFLALTIEIQGASGDDYGLWYGYQHDRPDGHGVSGLHDFLASQRFGGFLREILRIAQRDKPSVTNDDRPTLVNGENMVRLCKERLPH